MGSHSSDGHSGSAENCNDCKADYNDNASMKPSREEMGLGPTCFPYGTLIDTPSGTMEIGKLKKGQMVLSYDSGKLVPRVITRKRERGMALILRVEFKGGQMLPTTGHHSFLTKGGWKKMATIRPGDEMLRADGCYSTVEGFSVLEKEPVFNIYTAGEHNFIAGGFVAHNFTVFRTVRTILHRIFLDPLGEAELQLARRASSGTRLVFF